MKRNVTLKSVGITVNAKIDTKELLTRDEIEHIKDSLADGIMDLLAKVPYIPTYKNKIIVSN